MKGLMTFLFCLLLSFTVEAGVKFETYNTNGRDWMSDSISVTKLDITDVHDDLILWTPSEQKLNHDTLREYIVGLDTVIILHRIECDTSFTGFFVENDSTFVQIEEVVCDTIFRVEYRDVWAPKIQLWLDSLQWQKLLRILE